MEKIEYELIRSSRRTLAVEVDAAGRVLVRAPRLMPKWRIEIFVKERTDWIQRARQRQARRQQNLPEIREEDNFEDIHDRLGVLGAEALMETIKLLREGKLKPVKQDDSLATYAAKIEKADCALDFTRPARQLHDQIRGMSPFPLAFTHLPGGSMLKITRARVEADEGQGTPGQVVSLEDGIVVQCGQGRLRLLGVLPEGKGRMAAADFVRGRKIAEGDILN